MMLKSASALPKTGKFFFLAAILAIVFFSYFPTLKNDFVFWDDDTHLYENITVRTLDYEHIKDIFTGMVNKTYIPLTILSFAIEYHYFGYEPFVYHLDNVLLHLGVTALVFWLGWRLGLGPAGSGAAALLFGIHPMHVESVAWVTERKDVLYSLFYLAALLGYSRYLKFTKSTPSIQHKKSYRYLVITVMFGFFSMLAKPMALSLPLILLLFDWFHGRKMAREAILEKLPLVFVIAGITWVTYAAHARVPVKNPSEAILIWPWTFIFYLRQFVFPFVLAPVYNLPKPVSFLNPEYSVAAVVLCLLIFAVIRFRKHRWFIFSIAFYFLSIFFLLRYDDAKDTNIVADRFMYLPSLGFCFLAGYGFERICRRKRMYALPAYTILVILSIVFTVKTYRQSQIWHDSISLWRHELKIYPDEPVALNNLAAALREREDYKRAEKVYKKFVEIRFKQPDFDFTDELKKDIQKVDDVLGLYQKAIQAAPDFIESYYHLGNLYADLGRIPEAVGAYKETLRLDYTYKDAHYSLGALYQNAGDHKQAVFAYDQTVAFYPRDEDVYVTVISAYNKALKEDPRNLLYRQARGKAMESFTHLISNKPPRATSFFNLGYVYSEMGEYARAVSAYQMALDVNPLHSNTLYNLGNLYKDQGRLNDALAMYRNLVKVAPRRSDAYLNMGAIYKRQGNEKQAKENFQKAIRADPKNARAYFDLGYIEEIAGNLQKAIDLYQKSIELDSGNKEAHYNLGNTFARKGNNSMAIAYYLNAVKVDPYYMDSWVNLSIVSYKEGDFDNAVKYCDEAILLGYKAPQGYLKTLAPYRKKDLNNR